MDENRKIVVVVIEYEAENTDEILGIHEDTNTNYSGVTRVHARFGNASDLADLEAAKA